jgi:hypothetical protein
VKHALAHRLTFPGALEAGDPGAACREESLRRLNPIARCVFRLPVVAQTALILLPILTVAVAEALGVEGPPADPLGWFWWLLTSPIGWLSGGYIAMVSALVVGHHRDLAFLRGRTDASFAALERDIALLRGEMKTLAAELRGEMKTLATELRGEMRALRVDLKLRDDD